MTARHSPITETFVVLCLMINGAQSSHAEPLDALDYLPPELSWAGKSRSLIVSDKDPWITPSEQTGLIETPRYDETFAWLKKLVSAAPELNMVSIGQSHEGRDIWMIIASNRGDVTAEAMKESGKPLVLVQAGIHSGEIDGKDAGLMLLRDMTVRGTQSEILNGTNLLFVPILNVDGHERFSKYNRMNQRGPVQMGWRTNARNQNLNRDYMKLDTPGIRAVLRVISEWQPDLYVDIHVTDGADYQYDVTYGGNGIHGWSPNIGTWLENVYRPRVDELLSDYGHIPGPLIWVYNDMDFEDGNKAWASSPRYSNGYGDARHLPTVLVENHSLKPYPQRVLGTYVYLLATLDVVARENKSLKKATERDAKRRPASISLDYDIPADTPETMTLKAVRSERFLGPVSGGVQVRWTGDTMEAHVANLRMSEATITVTRPAAYLIPAARGDIAKILRRHGIVVSQLEQAETWPVEVYRLPEAKMAAPKPFTPNPFEGHLRITPGTVLKESREQTFAAGTYRVDTDQALGDLAVLLLEPESPDSLFQWGFFLGMLNRTEYTEGYVMEPMAQQILKNDPALAKSFHKKLIDDTEFAGDASARLDWFYERTPYYDKAYLVYPVARLGR